MLSGEDFGYLKDEEQHRFSAVAKKALLIGGVLFSISCFVYITISAYYFVNNDKDSNIKVIKSPPEPIKVVEGDGEGVAVRDIDKTIYDNIVGNKHLSHENLDNVRIVEQAKTPSAIKKSTKEAQREIVVDNSKNSPPVATMPSLPENKTVDNVQNKSVASQNISKNGNINGANQNMIQNGNNSQYQNRPNSIAPATPQKINNSNMMVYDAQPTGKVNDASLGSGVKKDQPKEQVKSAEPQPKNPIKGFSRVQVAALTSKNSAVDYWSKLKKTYPNLLSNLNYFISEVNLGTKGTFYRLQIGNFRNQVDAENFCQKFIFQAGKSKADCIIVE